MFGKKKWGFPIDSKTGFVQVLVQAKGSRARAQAEAAALATDVAIDNGNSVATDAMGLRSPRVQPQSPPATAPAPGKFSVDNKQAAATRAKTADAKTNLSGASSVASSFSSAGSVGGDIQNTTSSAGWWKGNMRIAPLPLNKITGLPPVPTAGLILDDSTVPKNSRS